MSHIHFAQSAFVRNRARALLKSVTVLASIMVMFLGPAGLSPTAWAATPRHAAVQVAHRAMSAPTAQLNLSSIACLEDLSGRVEVHFVVVNLPDGVTPGALTFYGTWPGGTGSATLPAFDAHTGNVYHYSYFGSSGFYEITGATVQLSDGTSLDLHNPGSYTGTYTCQHCWGEASCTSWTMHFEHPLEGPTTVTVYARIAGTWVLAGQGYSGPTTEPTTISGPWLTTMPARSTLIRFDTIYGLRLHVSFATRPACTQ
jgi:hypothetical protein